MKSLLIGLVLLFLGCTDKPLATSIVELSDNQKIVGWKDEKSIQKPKVVVKKIYISPKLKFIDSDKDGVIDNLDKCPNTPRNLIVDHNGCPIITTLRFNFDFDKAIVKKIYYPKLKKIAETLNKNPSLKIEIAGYTDNIGSKEYNLKLSLRRAKVVENILVNKYHISPKRIIVKGYGEDYPLVSNTTSTNRALNRRVEIVDVTNSKDYFKVNSLKSINSKILK